MQCRDNDGIETDSNNGLNLATTQIALEPWCWDLNPWF